MTPREVKRRYSNGRVLETVLRKGYKKRGMWAERKRERVSGWLATHWRSARELHTRLLAWAVKAGGQRRG